MVNGKTQPMDLRSSCSGKKGGQLEARGAIEVLLAYVLLDNICVLLTNENKMNISFCLAFTHTKKGKNNQELSVRL